MHLTVLDDVPKRDTSIQSLPKGRHREDPEPKQVLILSSLGKACLKYNNGLPCNKSQCRFVHDDAARNQAIKKRAATTAEKNKPQRQQNSSEASIATRKKFGTAKSQQVCRDFAKGSCTRRNCPFIHGPTVCDVANVTNKLSNNDWSLKAPANKIKSNGLLPEKNNSLRIQQNGKKACYNFAKGCCNKGNDCRFSHDIDTNKSPRDEAKPKTGSLPSNQNPSFKKPTANEVWQKPHSHEAKEDKTIQKKLSFKEIQAAEEILKDWQPKTSYSVVVGQFGGQIYKAQNNGSPKGSTAAERAVPNKKVAPAKLSYAAMAAPPTIKVQKVQSAASKTQAAKPVSKQIVTLPQPDNVETTNLGFGSSWDNLTLKKWANENLRPEVMAYYLKTYGKYLDRGVLPVAILELDPTNPRPKVRKAKFRNFGRLPCELRGQIWNYALDVVKFDCRIGLRREKSTTPGLNASIIARSAPPEILKVNRQVRELALKRWELKFPTKTSDLRRCYFNFSSDRLFIHGTAAAQMPHIARSILPEDRLRIQYIAVPLRDYSHGDKDLFFRAIMLFKSLKELSLVVGDSKEDESYAQGSFVKHITERFRKEWDRAKRDTPLPHIARELIPALKAKYYGIDGLIWDASVSV